MKIQLFKEFKPYLQFLEKDVNDREINIYKFNNCSLTGYNLYYPNVLLKTENNLLLPLLERTMSLKFEKNNMEFEYKKKELIKNFDIPVFFFIYNIDNYYHFLYDSLPYLISFFELKKTIPNLKLLIQYPNPQKNEFYKFNIEFFEILGILKENLIILDENTNYKYIYISTSYTHDIDSNLPPRNEIYEFYQKIVKNVKLKYNTPKNIYISRRTWLHNDSSNIGTNYTTKRKLINENELVDELIKKDYVEVFTENLSTIEKILYFANAENVIGAIGGGIANVLFSPKKTRLIALISPTFLDVNKRFKFSLDNVNVEYFMNTEHIEKTEFKTYMRIKNKDIIGEIEKIYENTVLVSYTNFSNTGWNSNNIYKQMKLNKNEIEKLDNGLNSPWKIDLELLLF
jgi:hypothetical protein